MEPELLPRAIHGPMTETEIIELKVSLKILESEAAPHAGNSRT
jgi:hypothetical protein